MAASKRWGGPARCLGTYSTIPRAEASMRAWQATYDADPEDPHLVWVQPPLPEVLTERPATRQQMEPCSWCGGHGIRHGVEGDPVDCRECGGGGMVAARDERGRFLPWVPS